MNIDDILHQDARLNGDFREVATFSQGMKFLLRRAQKWDVLPNESQEALETISTNIAMIISGDNANPDPWNAIVLLARQCAKRIEEDRIEDARARIGDNIMNMPSEQRRHLHSYMQKAIVGEDDGE